MHKQSLSITRLPLGYKRDVLIRLRIKNSWNESIQMSLSLTYYLRFFCSGQMDQIDLKSKVPFSSISFIEAVILTQFLISSNGVGQYEEGVSVTL